MDETQRPAGDWLGSFVLERPAIELAVFEVRYSSVGKSVTVSEGLAIRDAVRKSGLAFAGSVDPAVAHQVTLSLGAGGPEEARTTADGVQMTDAGRGLVATVMPESLAVQTSVYHRWSESFKPVLAALLEGVGEVLRPTLRTRVGLRYVNRFTDAYATSPTAWADRFVAPLVAVLAEGPFASRLQGAQQQIELGLGNGMTAALRHGCFQDFAAQRNYSYLLDIDVFSPSAETFDPANTLEIAEHLNRQAAELFRATLTPAYAEQLGFHSVQSSEEGQPR